MQNFVYHNFLRIDILLALDDGKHLAILMSVKPKELLGENNISLKFFDHPVQAKNLGPVVQSIVSLTSSLRVILLTVLANSIYTILIFFAEKMCVAFALQKLLTFFQQKNFSIFAYHSMKIFTNR